MTRVMLIAAFCFISACSKDKEAAEIINSVAHVHNRTQSIIIPRDLTSGQCRHLIQGTGQVSWDPVSITGNIINYNLAVDLGFAGTCPGSDCVGFQCNLNVSYELNADATGLVGAGDLISCTGFSCNLRGKSVGCEELKKALKENPCTTSNTL